MTLDKNRIISAQVILRPAGGGSLRDYHPITARNVHEAMPAAKSVEQATTAFRLAGFDIGAVAGASFSISAPAGRFQKALGVKLELEAGGGIQCVLPNGQRSYELPLEKVPREAARVVEAITFTPPPDFGPTRF